MTGDLAAAGDVATGMLVAHAIDPKTSAVPAAAVQPLCLNCGTRLAGEFCHRCRQTQHIHRTLASIGHDLLHGVFHFEGKIWRTLPMLFTRPGALTRRYIAGERARFVSPLALFLFSVFLMVATFETVGGPIGGNSSAERKAASLTPARLERDIADTTSKITALETERAVLAATGQSTAKLDIKLNALRDTQRGLQSAKALTQGDFSQPLLNTSVHSGNAVLDERVTHALKEPKLFLYKLQSTAYKFSWALIPISLPFIWLLFAFRRDVGPYDHAIFAIYSLSAMTMGTVVLTILSAIGVPGGLIGTVFVFGPPFHMYRQLKGAYGLGRLGALWRTVALVLSAYLAGLLFFVAILGLIAE
ncbi:DUF3667 domain-containing protein [Sphingomonas sp. TREG-RG-20F-R18-01]|uniref:DUF3667 domain-containing protein n=1 Tax=Sphingomonas sp. TREG-RG-20F-R18-01 TaxID=2914982 RepID=UPI001F5A4BF0|nr:DUF3667 domain-containing protein [Sphingomonas sp. TREG-RG-20F-R18-01]